MTPDDTIDDAASPLDAAPDSPSDAKGPTPRAAEPPRVASHVADTLEAASIQANLSAVVHVHAEEFEAVGSAVGVATVGRDAVITASATPLVYARGDVHIRQSYVSAVLAAGDMEVSQAGAPVIIGKKLSVDQGGGMVMLAGEAEVSRGFVGVLLTPKATISDDSKVLLSTRAALVIAAALFGGFALVAVVMALGMRRVVRWRPHIAMPAMPHVAMPAMQQMPDLARLAEHLRHRDAA